MKYPLAQSDENIARDHNKRPLGTRAPRTARSLMTPRSAECTTARRGHRPRADGDVHAVSAARSALPVAPSSVPRTTGGHSLGRPMVDHWSVRGGEGVWCGYVAKNGCLGVRGGEKWLVNFLGCVCPANPRGCHCHISAALFCGDMFFLGATLRPPCMNQ